MDDTELRQQQIARLQKRVRFLADLLRDVLREPTESQRRNYSLVRMSDALRADLVAALDRLRNDP